MKVHSTFSILIILLSAACIDRIFIDVGRNMVIGIVIDGHISEQPGPYTITITDPFDIESKYQIKTTRSVKHLIISDNLETLRSFRKLMQGNIRPRLVEFVELLAESSCVQKREFTQSYAVGCW